MTRRTTTRVRRLLALPLVLAVLGACAPAASDTDEVLAEGSMSPAAPKSPDATPVLVDTDLAPDDLAALALLLRSPDVRVVGISVPATGQLDCRGLGLLDDFFDAMELQPPPVACGTTARGDEGVPFPYEWGAGALTRSGLPRDDEPDHLEATKVPAARLIARLAREHDGLRVVALGPLTELAAVLRDDPAAYALIAGIHTMQGNVDAESHDDGVAEWNAAADPVPFAEVVAGPVPVTIVPDDPVRRGAPEGLAGPVVGGLGRVAEFSSPAYWDLPTAGIFLEPSAAEAVTGTWEVDTTDDRGRLHRTGDGPVAVVTSLDDDALDELYRELFG